MTKQVNANKRSADQWEIRLARNRALVSSLKEQVKYQVFGKGIERATWIFFYPDELVAKVAKYEEKDQWLFGPLLDGSEYAVN